MGDKEKRMKAYLVFIISHLGSLKDIVVILTAITTVSLAVAGFVTWKRRIITQYELEISRRILHATYRVREAFRTFRKRFMYAPYPEDEVIKKLGSKEEKDRYAVAKIFEQKFETLNTSISDLDIALLEGEVIWGSGFKEKFIPIYKARTDLIGYVHQYLFLIRPDSKASFDEEAIVTAADKIFEAYSFPEHKEDKFMVELEGNIRLIEDFVRSRIR